MSGRGSRPGDRRGVVGHVLDGDLEGVLVAEHGVGDRVADEDQVDPGGVGDPGARRRRTR